MKQILTTLLSVLMLGQVNAQQYESVKKEIDHQLDSIFKANSAPGISLSVVFPDGSTSSFVKGLANVEKNEPMTAETRMLGGSTGKVFYSVVAMQLIDEGKLSLDEPIINQMADYDWFKRIPNADKLTVRNLMRHQSGIPRYVFKQAFQQQVVKDADRVWKPEELLAFVLDDEPMFEVGTSFAYSDTNYIVLCMLIEKVTGNDLYDEVQRRVLDKAGLTEVVPQTKRSYANLAQGYNGEDDPFFPGKALDASGKSRYNLQFEWAGGGMVITTRSLAKLGKLIYEGKMFSASALNEYTKGIDAGRQGGLWGLAVHILQSPQGTTYGHSGFMPGYMTNLVYNVEDRFAVCYQVNSSERASRGVMRGLYLLSNQISVALRE